ncbi:hypothetical protein [Anaerotignum sp.]
MEQEANQNTGRNPTPHTPKKGQSVHALSFFDKTKLFPWFFG